MFVCVSKAVLLGQNTCIHSLSIVAVSIPMCVYDIAIPNKRYLNRNKRQFASYARATSVAARNIGRRQEADFSTNENHNNRSTHRRIVVKPLNLYAELPQNKVTCDVYFVMFFFMDNLFFVGFSYFCYFFFRARVYLCAICIYLYIQ